MSAPVISRAPDDDVKHAMSEMTRWHIRHPPVIADGELPGILGIGDVVENLPGQTHLEVEMPGGYARTH